MEVSPLPPQSTAVAEMGEENEAVGITEVRGRGEVKDQRRRKAGQTNGERERVSETEREREREVMWGGGGGGGCERARHALCVFVW